MAKKSMWYPIVSLTVVIGAAVGCGSESSDPVGFTRQAYTQTTFGFSTPASGNWSFAVYGAAFASGGSTNASGDLSTSGSVSWSSFDGNVNGASAASYLLCNNTGDIRTFRVNLYSSTGYTTLLASHSQRVINNSCKVVNIGGAYSATASLAY